jgi:Putative Flp pilus-assembly TadE/G-like
MNMKRMREESGQTLIMVALCLTCILGFVGFATDVGVLLHAKRNLQIAADAAAIAGANEINIDSTKIVSAAKAASATNGVTDGSNGTVVTVTNGPLYGPNKGKAGYIEAIITAPQPTFFMGLLRHSSSMPVAARAVAFNGANNGSGCLHALNGNDPDTINLQGSFTLNAPGCQVLDNSSAACALDFTGAAGRLTAGSVSVAGTSCGHTSDSTPAPQKGPQVSDPLASTFTPIPQASWPACGAAPSGDTWGTSGGKTYNPSGISGGGTTLFCYSSGTDKVGNSVTMNPGTYIFTGSLGLKGSGSLAGPLGVTIYLAAPDGNMNMGGSGTSNLSLTAPSTGPFANVAIYQEPLDTNPVNLEGTPIIGVGAGAGLTGIIYLPSAMLELGGTSTTQILTTDLIVDKLFIFGNATVNIADDSVTHNTPLHTIALVE